MRHGEGTRTLGTHRLVRRGFGALAGLVALSAALWLAAGGQAALIVGVNDSTPLDPSMLGWFYPTMASEGLTLDTLTIRWDDTTPTVIDGQAQVAAAIAKAAENGVQIELDLYPLHSMVFTDDQQCAPSPDPQACGNTAEIDAFASWTAQVAQAFPTVHEFVVMNECNQDLFINPQFNTAGQNQSAEICGRALAASYDALKQVNADDFVWGVGLSPRGNDNPAATSDASTSPVMFLQDLGAWFKSFVAATGRTTPLMDGLDFHPYPIPQSQPFAQGYEDPNDASVSNLSRIYQAFYNGFNGSPQPTIGQQEGGGLPVSLNEVGIQTLEAGVPGYTGSKADVENSTGGVYGQYATQQYQATWYVQMLNLVACDPNVRLVNIFGLIDEADLAGWQAGLYDINRNPKLSAGAVHDWIASTQGTCQGALQSWTPSGVPAAGPLAPPVAPKPSGSRVVVASAGRLRIFDALSGTLRRVLAPFGTAYTGPLSAALGTTPKTSEIAVAEGQGGGANIEILNGKTGREIGSLSPFGPSFSGGYSLAFEPGALPDTLDLVVGSGPGMPASVRVYADLGTELVEHFEPFGASFHGGVSVATGVLGTPGTEDLVVGTGPGVRAQVNVYAGLSTTPIESLEPFAASFDGGVAVTTTTLASGAGALVVGTGEGRAGVVKAYVGATKTRAWSVDAFGSSFVGGLALASFVPATGGADVVVGAGAGGGAEVKVLDGSTGGFVDTFLGDTGSAAIGIGAA